MAPFLPPRKMQVGKVLTLKKSVVDLPKPEINQDFN